MSQYCDILKSNRRATPFLFHIDSVSKDSEHDDYVLTKILNLLSRALQ